MIDTHGIMEHNTVLLNMTKKTQLKYITLTFIARAYGSQFHLK